MAFIISVFDTNVDANSLRKKILRKSKYYFLINSVPIVSSRITIATASHR